RTCSSPAPRRPAATRRASAAREAAATRRASPAGIATARTAGIEEDVERNVEEEPAEPGRNDEQRHQGDRRGDEEPRHPFGGLLSVEAQRRALLPFRAVGGQDRDDVIDAARDPAAEITGLQ